MKGSTVSWLALLSVLTAFSACVHSETTGFKSASYEDARFKAVVVSVSESDFAKRQHYEDALVSALVAQSVRAVSSIKLFPPADEWSAEQMASTLSSKGLDTMLLLETVSEAHGTEVIGEDTQVQYYRGGASVRSTPITRTQHALDLTIRLVDASNGHTIWTGQSRSQGGANGLAGRLGAGSQLIESIAGDVAEQLKQAHLFEPARRPSYTSNE